MKKNFKLTITKLALEGYGIGFHEGKAVFVPYTAAGDEIEAELLRERKDVAFARVKEYLRRGEGVIPSSCSSFAADLPCGGCDWLCIDYPTQLKYKTDLLRELLRPLAPELEIPATTPSPEIRHYRNKAFMPVGAGEKGLSFGIYARWSHQIVPHEACQLHPAIFDTIARRCLQIMDQTGVKPYNEMNHTGTLRHIGFRCSRDRKKILLVLVTRSGKLPFTQLLVKQLTAEFPAISGIVQNINRERGNVILGPEEKLLFGEPWLQENLAGLRFRVHYRSFWQVNTGTLELIINHLKSRIPPSETIYDAFSGLGALGLSLAGEAQHVLCIEDNPNAVADGELNRQQNRIDNAGFLCARVEDALPALFAPTRGEAQPRPGIIILDPPRSGVRQPALAAIIEAKIPRIFYLSCSPITLHRDLKILLDSGFYRLERLRSFDMFPHTWHIETLAELALVSREAK